MRGKSNRQSSVWITKKIKALVDSSQEMASVNDVHYPGHAWSVVKLLLLAGWVYVYTTIIPKYFEHYWYIDLLAGSGTTYVKETRDVVAGSPFISHFFAREPFEKYVYVEQRHDRCVALQQRVNKLMGGKAEVYEGDCNRLIDSILPTGGRSHGLVFVDNEGFNVVWSTVEAVLQSNTDVLILFPTSSVERVVSERTRSSLNNFYGRNSWMEAQEREDFLNIYVQQLIRRFAALRRKEAYSSNVRVGSGQFFYDIILTCKDGPYVRAWEYLKKRFDWKDPRIIETALDVLKGRATQIDWFIDLQEKVASLEPRQQSRRKYRKTTLNNFRRVP